MISTSTYVICFSVAFLGAFIRTASHYKSLLNRAHRNNLQFDLKKYMALEKVSIVISIASIVICLFFITEMGNVHERALDFIKFVFAFIGYASDHLISKLAGAASKKIDAAIDHKTTIADNASGTTNEPTPI